MNWKTLYENDIAKHGGIKKYYRYKLRNKKRLIKLVQNYSHNLPLIECGCGTGLLSLYFANLGREVFAIDINNEMLALSRQIADELHIASPPKYMNNSIFELDKINKKFGVAFSNGVLEHFSDEQIISTLKQQTTLSNYCVFGIPTTYFLKEVAMFGDERYLKLKIWRKLISESGCQIVKESSFSYYGFLKDLMRPAQWFSPKAFHIFVVKQRNSN